MKFLRRALWPFSLIYGLIVVIRNYLFDRQILRSTSFNLPVISVGNLAVGGAGKTPMTEYVARLLKNDYHIATLSRGYGRNTKGFLEITGETSAANGGDEPVQLKNNMPDITVAVCEDRVTGINFLKEKASVILLDDAYQHRYVKPGLSILLFDFTRLFDLQMLLPAGDLREPMSGKSRADVIVVTKTPPALSQNAREKIFKRIKPVAGQELFFSYLDYADMEGVYQVQTKALSSIGTDTHLVLLTGIANPDPLVAKLHEFTSHIAHVQYADHHPFTTKNIAKLANLFNTTGATDKIILTTEKDAQRLKDPEIAELLKDLPVYYLPVRAVIHLPERERFDNLIVNYAANYLQNN
ncbi:tetraacyldisaccharide 4'-kinase [Pedobacter sp. HMF7647]|uniref:Tetraacyldisaccharide 4'-kinase n=1 Tax=Hufsiella arboris TaxID=2695275 RepID=A0A7K1YDP7_9SPHI|nr:tetraacyldisaccharide 4'-kinase [Hufsiella arboris]MXV52723.1 tetraacyldisaccharide 4'-kinase [Hufsiella arboris]